MGFRRVEPCFVKLKGNYREVISLLSLSLHISPSSLSLSFFRSSEDLKGPETQPQLV